MALRVELRGACQAHAKVAADWVRWTNEFRQSAIELGSGRVWVEKVQARTFEPTPARVRPGRCH